MSHIANTIWSEQEREAVADVEEFAFDADRYPLPSVSQAVTRLKAFENQGPVIHPTMCQFCGCRGRDEYGQLHWSDCPELKDPLDDRDYDSSIGN